MKGFGIANNHMKNIKKFLTIVLSATLLSSNVASLPLIAYADTEVKNYDIDKSSLYWDITDSKVFVGWDETEDKTSFKVRLYKGNKAVTQFITTNKNTYDFTNYILENGSGTYKFYVYATKKGRDSQLVSETQTIDSEQITDLKKNNPNYKSSSSKKTSTTQKSSSGVTYNTTSSTSNTNTNVGPGANLPSSSGASPNTSNFVKGWNKLDNTWYWLNDDNTLATNTWKEVSGKWYFFNENSAMVTGWKEINKLWYYFDNNSGDMLVDTITPDNYKVNADGVWVK